MLEALSVNQFRVQGELGMRDSTPLLRELLALPKKLQTEEVLHLDISALAFTDSLLLAAMLDLQRQLQHHGKRLLVRGMKDDMLSLARVYGIDSLLKDMMEMQP
ncbi:MAG: STAS domain-containing protein [Pseudomonadales bacterium]